MSNPTEATAPDTTPTDTSVADQTAATAATSSASTEGGAGGEGTPPEATAPAPDREQTAVAAFKEGLEQVASEAPRTAADVAAQAAAAAPAPSTAAAPAAAPSPAAADASGATTAAAPDLDTDKAVKELGLKGRAEERFREMAETIKETAPLREVLAKHQIADPARIEAMVESANRAVEWENTVIASTATPEQFGSALNVIKAMNSGDPKVMNVAFDALLQEVSTLGKKLGREVPGLIDPLTDHPDLQNELESGELTRKRALEIAAQRATHAQIAARDTQEGNARQHQQAMERAATDLTTLNNQLKATDPDFARKLPLLQPTLDLIRETMHPSKWVDAIAKAYQRLPALPAAPAPAPAPAPAARPPVSHMPVRATGTATVMQPKPKNAIEAFKLGLKTVTPD